MLTFSDILPNEWDIIKALTPQQYLSWRLRQSFEQNKAHYAKMEDIGCELVYINNCCDIVCVDPSKFWAFVGDDIPDEIKSRLIKDLEVMTNPSRPGLLDDVVRISLKLTGDAKGRLEQIPVGLASIPIFNAGAGPVPMGGEVIIINDGLRAGIDFLTGYYSKISDELSEGTENIEDIIEAFITNSDEVGAIFCAINGIASKVDSMPRFPIMYTEEQEAGIRRLNNMLMFFVLLHEYGHVILGHVEELRCSSPEWKLSKSELRKRYSKMRKWEIEADIWACNCLVSNVGSERRNESILYLAHIYAILHISYSLLRSEVGVLETHPSGEDRYNNIMKSFKFSRVERSEAKNIKDLWYLIATASGITVDRWSVSS
ncbi:hypothetical protein ACFLV4_04225 [Chloroflexota bacterium]